MEFFESISIEYYRHYYSDGKIESSSSQLHIFLLFQCAILSIAQQTYFSIAGIKKPLVAALPLGALLMMV